MQPVRMADRPTVESTSRASRSSGGARHGVRDQILEAALVEFAGKGFQEASLAAIARRLGVTAPLVLYHFGSKANLWREAVGVFCANWGAAVEAAATEGRGLSGRDALRLMILRLVEFLANDRAACRLLRDEGAIATGQDEWFTSRNLRPILDVIESVYRRAVDEGAVRPAPFRTTLFLILGAACCRLESRALSARLFGADAEEDANTPEDYAEQVVRFCFDGLSMPPKRPVLSALRTPSRSASASATTTKPTEVVLR